MFRKLLAGAAVLSVLGLASCGGGGSGGSSGGGASVPTLNVSLSATSGSAQVTEGATVTALTVTATSSGHVSTAVVPDLQYDHAVFASVTAVAGATAGTYVVTAQTLPDLSNGEYKGNITFRLCQETACTHVYAGSSVTYAYDVTVKLQDWATTQRNSAHNGYVHVTLDAAKFSKAWEWVNPYSQSSLKPVITGNDMAFITASNGKVYSLNESTGAQNWVHDVSANLASIGSVAYNQGMIYVPTHNFDGSGEYGVIWELNALTGEYKSDSHFDAQWSTLNSPTIYDNEMFYAAGYNGGVIYKYSLPGGAETWQSTAVYSNAWDGQTPAVDQKYIYYNTYFGLAVFNRGDGTLFANIADVKSGAGGYTFFGAPLLTSTGHVVLLELPNYGRALMSYDIASQSVLWRITGQYEWASAASGAVIYAIRNSPAVLDAINDSDGSKIWSWALPAPDTQLTNNPIVVDNLVFVSSDKTTYAIDLTTHQQVWSYPAHGALSLSANLVLYITEDNYSGKVTAIKLK